MRAISLKSKTGIPILYDELMPQWIVEVHSYAYWMLLDDDAVQQELNVIFKAFGKESGKLTEISHVHKKDMTKLLFQVAVLHIETLSDVLKHSDFEGRDTREEAYYEKELKNFNLALKNIAMDQQPILRKSLSNIEVSLRTALVLRDFVRLDEALIADVLGVRWGVYRHRLNRARAELCGLLFGTNKAAIPLKSEIKNEVVNVLPVLWWNPCILNSCMGGFPSLGQLKYKDIWNLVCTANFCLSKCKLKELGFQS